MMMLRGVLLALCVLGAVADSHVDARKCSAVDMTVTGGLCDGMKAPAKACAPPFPGVTAPGDEAGWVRAAFLKSLMWGIP